MYQIWCVLLQPEGQEQVVFNITTVEQQKDQYSTLDVERAKKVQKLQETKGFISNHDLLQVIDHNIAQKFAIVTWW